MERYKLEVFFTSDRLVTDAEITQICREAAQSVDKLDCCEPMCANVARSANSETPPRASKVGIIDISDDPKQLC